MGYPPEPPPERSELGERHELQRLAHSIGYVAVPEMMWWQIVEALRVGLIPCNDVCSWMVNDPSAHHAPGCRPDDEACTCWVRSAPEGRDALGAALATAIEVNERIRQERE